MLAGEGTGGGPRARVGLEAMEAFWAAALASASSFCCCLCERGATCLIMALSDCGRYSDGSSISGSESETSSIRACDILNNVREGNERVD